jgi:acetyl-CoA C-acetyltransferase
VEAYTVMHDRDGRPEQAIATCLLADGRRGWGTSHDPAVGAAMCAGEWVGRAVELTDDGALLA